MRIIKNRDAILDELTEMLKNFDMEMNKYQTDVYLYYDEEDRTAELDTFVNVSENSWLNDDHYTIYTDRMHTDNFFDFYSSVDEIAEAVGLTKEQLIEQAALYHDYTIDDVDTYDVCRYIESDDNLMDTFLSSRAAALDDRMDDYRDHANDILSEWGEEAVKKPNTDRKNNFAKIRESRKKTIEELCAATGIEECKLRGIDAQKIHLSYLSSEQMQKLADALDCRILDIYYPSNTFWLDAKGRLIVDRLFYCSYDVSHIWGRIKNNYFMMRIRPRKNKPVIDRIIPTQKTPPLRIFRKQMTDMEYVTYYDCTKKHFQYLPQESAQEPFKCSKKRK